jgi:hypothetical protein
VVESGGLENRYPACGIEGSNPSLSAELNWIIKFKYTHMKAKFFFTVFFILCMLSSVSKPANAQDEMDFEEFMGMMSETMTDQQLDELSYQLPWNIKVTAYAYGDFSGNDRNDIVLAIKDADATPPKSVDVYFFQNIGDTTYQLIEKQNIKYVDLSIEVAFMVKDGECDVTRRDANNWYFTSYDIRDDSLEQIDEDVYPINIGNAGQ